MYGVETYLGTIMSGITVGSLYCIMSMGLTFLWGTLDIFNFTHGAFIMVGAFTAWIVTAVWGLNLVFALPLAFLVTFFAGLLVERFVMRPLIRGGFMPLTIATIALNMILINSAQMIFGTIYKRLPPIVEGGLSLGDFYLTSYHDLAILLTAVSVLIGLSVFLRKTKTGMAMRAVSQDKEACFLMGINVKVIYAIVVGIAIALAGFSGAFLGHLYFVVPTMGDDLLVIAFTIVVLGGLGSIKGTILASYIVGLVLAFSNLFVGVFYTPIVTFTIMLIMLAVRPRGLFGEG